MGGTKMGRWRRWVVLAAVTVVGFALDFATKAMVLGAIEPGELKVVSGNWLALTLAFNRGALFGLDPGKWIAGFPTAAFYIGVSVVVMVGLAWFYGRLDPKRNALAVWGLCLVAPGALGNFADRVMGRPGVVDFVLVDLGFWPLDPWPIFNVADICISVGVGLVLLDMVVDEVRARRRPAKAG
jgi:signal peptidase II